VVSFPPVVDRITSIVKLQPNITFDVYIATRSFYVACLNNYMFRPQYWPSSGCLFSYNKANYTIYNVPILVDEISFTAVEFTFKIITVLKKKGTVIPLQARCGPEG